MVILKTLSLNYSLVCNETKNIKKIVTYMLFSLLDRSFYIQLEAILCHQCAGEDLHTSTFWVKLYITIQRIAKRGLQNDGLF